MKTIFVLEDDNTARSVMKRYLNVRKFDVFSFENPVEALRFLKSNPKTKVDCFVTDNDMPQMTGTEFIPIARKKFPNANIIMVSGTNQENCQADKFMPKPVNLRELETLLT